MHAKRLAGVVLIVAALTLAACSSSGGKKTSSSGKSNDSVASTAAGGSQALTQAKAAIAQYTKIPTAITITEALPSPPPKGKTVVFLQCEQEQCGLEGKGVKAAAAAIGWNFKLLNFKASDPATLNAALKTALQYHPVGVFFAGVSQAVWGSMTAQYAKAGAFITENFDDLAPKGPGTLPGGGYRPENVKIGAALADEQFVDANGQSAKSLVVSVPDYQIFVPLAKAYTDQITKLCPSCSVSKVNATLPQLLGGQLIPAVVSAAKRVSGLKYIVSVNGAFVAQLPAALKAAGIKNVKIISGQGESADQNNVLKGDALATVSSPFELRGWQDVDMAVRAAMHLPVPAGDHVIPWVLLTKDNIGTPRDSFDVPADYATQYKKLWKVGA